MKRHKGIKFKLETIESESRVQVKLNQSPKEGEYMNV
jgi:hypothetical protein